MNDDGLQIGCLIKYWIKLVVTGNKVMRMVSIGMGEHGKGMIHKAMYLSIMSATLR